MRMRVLLLGKSSLLGRALTVQAAAEDIEFQKMKKQGEAKWLSSGGKPGGYTLTKNPTNPIELSYGKED
jgi:hypothetical protein